MELKYLTTFQTIVKEGSFAKAAEKLNYTQSTMTFHIDQLETEFHVQLFEKVGRRMVLTNAGEQFLPYVEGVMESLQRMEEFEQNIKGYNGVLRVGVAETQICYRLPAVLKEFHRQAPNAQLLLQSMNCYDIRDELIRGNLDLGVFYKDVGGVHERITAYDLGDFETVLVASKETASQFNDFKTAGQSLPIPFIINEKNCIFRQIFERYLGQKSINLQHTIELWSIPTIKKLVASDMGISYLPRFTVESELETGELVTIPTEIEDGLIHAVVGHNKNKWLSPAMELFVELCQ